MELLILVAGAVVMMATAAYAHYRIPAYTDDAFKIRLTRVILMVTGAGFGLVWAANYPQNLLLAVLAFLIGFGAVHVPAAFIVYIKQARGAGKS